MPKSLARPRPLRITMTVRLPSIERLAIALRDALDNFDVGEPQTSINRIERAAQAAVAGVPPRTIERDLGAGFRAALSERRRFADIRQDLLREAKRNAKRDPRYSLLMKLAADTGTTAPHLALLVWNAFPRDEHIQSILLPAPHFDAAARASGESRVREVLSAMKAVGARLYEPYLRCLVNLVLAHNNDHRLATGSLGVLVDRVTSMLSKYPGLVDSASGLLRNADAHYRWKYDDRADCVTIWHSSRPVSTYAASVLVEQVQALWRMSGTTFLAVRDLLMLRVLERVFTEDVLVQCLSAFLSGDAESLAQLSSVVEQRLVASLGPARAHLQQLAERRQVEEERHRSSNARDG